MRIYFQNASVPTRAAKRLKAQQGIKDSEARRVTSIVLGYRNWADLENVLNKEAASPLDEACDLDTFRKRRQYQAEQLSASGLDLKGLSPGDVISRWQPSAARPQTPVNPGPDPTSFNEADFSRTLLGLYKNRAIAAKPHADTLFEGIRQTADNRQLRLAASIAQGFLDGTRGREPELARQMLELLAERGDAVSIFNLSTSLGMGDGGPKDGKRATDLLENLASSPTTPEEVRAMALSRLGGCYSKGQTRGVDNLKALKLW
jgi:hypothetical protein